jgi:flagellar assembly protein FliH
MLSKVLKGSDARSVPAMAFATAAAPPFRTTRAAATERPAPGGEEQTALLDKIRSLEAAMAVVRREAFDAGREQGEQQARAALTPLLERLNASIAEIVNMRPEMRRCAEKDAVELSLHIARRVLHRELTIDGNALNALARVVFDRLGRSETWQLTVHPQFAEAIRGSLPAGSAERVRIHVDASCAPGTFVERSEDGTIDASVDSQLAEIGRGLTDRLTLK